MSSHRLGGLLTNVITCQQSRSPALHGAALHMTGCGAGHQSCADLGSLVDVCHRGQVTLKGVPLPIVVMTLTPLILSGRMFPASLPGSSKAKLVAESKGLQCSVRLSVSRSP